MENEIALYLDLDGVFTNFVKAAYSAYTHFHHIHGLHHDMDHTLAQKKLKKEFIQTIIDTPDFWLNLEWEQGGITLFTFIEYWFNMDNVAILTAPIDEDLERCTEQKWKWSKKNFGILDKRRFFVDHNKHNYVNKLPGKHQILIDDRKSNIVKWEQAGGIGILHDSNNFHVTIERLKEFIH